MLNIMVKLTLTERSTKLGGGKDDRYEMVILRGDAQVAAGTVGCTMLVNPEDALGATFPRMVNVDYCDWPSFSASRMFARGVDQDTVYETCSGLWPGTELLMQCEIAQRAGDKGRQILGINIIDAAILSLPPMEEIEADKKPQLLASLQRALSNGRPAAPAAPGEKK